MRRLVAWIFDRISARLSLQFKVLHRQFLLRVIDLEALSIEADIPRFPASLPAFSSCSVSFTPSPSTGLS
jgi:hypothetical protein